MFVEHSARLWFPWMKLNRRRSTLKWFINASPAYLFIQLPPYPSMPQCQCHGNLCATKLSECCKQYSQSPVPLPLNQHACTHISTRWCTCTQAFLLHQSDQSFEEPPLWESDLISFALIILYKRSVWLWRPWMLPAWDAPQWTHRVTTQRNKQSFHTFVDVLFSSSSFPIRVIVSVILN